MSSEVPRRLVDRLVAPARGWGAGASTAGRVLAWLALIGASGLLVRAEVRRPELPVGVEAFTDLTYHETGLRRLRLDVYVPTGSAPKNGRPALVAIHGGGWRGGSRAEYGRSIAASMAPYGVVVVSVDYRLSRPGAPTWPGNLDDVREAVRWVRHHAEDFEVDPERIALVGSSAGAHLALMAAFEANHSPGGDHSARVAAVVDLYGPTDLRALRASRAATGEPVTLMIGGRPEDMPERYDAASPLLHVAPQVPPVLIIHGDEDALVPLEQSIALDAKLTESGVPHKLMVVPGARHGFELKVGPSPRAAALDLAPAIFAFLDRVWSGKSRR